ncbi:MAG: hypothetical protein HY762_09025 [Planctomycetes bacterium]|nr:hypothetical protein [Planctomycetota bacterium]
MYATTSNIYYSELAKVSANTTTYYHSGLSGSDTYSYKIRAYNSSGNSGWSNEVYDSLIPSTPSNLTATAISDSQIRLTWTDNSDSETNFGIIYATTSDIYYKQLATVNANTTVYTHTGISGTDAFYYKVYAYNSHRVSIGSNEAYTYLPKWMTKTSMSTPRAYLAGGVVNNKIYCIGGLNASGHLATNEEYNPSTDTWIPKANMPTTRSALAVGVVNDKIYAIGGYNGINHLPTVEEYDPISDAWISKTPMPVSRSGIAAGVINNKIYVTGGYDGTNYYQSLLIYNPASDTWTTGADMPTKRAYHSVAVADVGSSNYRIYAIGGLDGPNTFNYLGSNEMYDLDLNIWYSRTTTIAIAYFPIGVVNNMIYTSSGKYYGDPTQNNKIYNPLTDQWDYKTDIPSIRSGCTAGVVNNKIYVIGGIDINFLYIGTNEVYIPVNDN